MRFEDILKDENNRSSLRDLLKESQQNGIQNLESMYVLEKEHTGISTKDHKNRFLLIPPLLKLAKEKEVIPNIFLTIHKRGYAILQISIRLTNYDLNQINVNMWESEIEKVLLPEFVIDNSETSQKYTKKSRINDITDLAYYYMGELLFLSKSNFVDLCSRFYHLSLTEFTHQPSEFKDSGGIEFKKLIQSLLNAPVNKFNLQSDEKINKFITENSYEFSRNLRFYCKSNRSISLSDKKFIEILKNWIKKNESHELTDLNEIIHNTNLGAIQNGIEIILLKKHSSLKNSVLNISETSTFSKLIMVKEIENTYYNLEFLQFFYRYESYRDLISFLNKACEGYLQTDLLKQRRMRIEKLIEAKKEKQVANISILGPILSIFISLAFSLQTLGHLFSLLEFKTDNLFLTYLILNSVFVLIVLGIYRESLFRLMNKVREYFYFLKLDINRVILMNVKSRIAKWRYDK